MTKNYSYADAGVDREQRRESKKALSILNKTYDFTRFGRIMHLPYSNIFPFNEDTYLDLTIEGVGTKVLLAQLAEKYDTIGYDAVAMAVNDVIRSGSRPLAISDNIHAQSSDAKLVNEWLKGIVRGAVDSQCPVVSGEIGDVAEIINGLNMGTGFDMIVATIGEVSKDKIVTGCNVKPEDPIIGFPSSGLHSNGISLARKVLLKQWGGKYLPDEKPKGLDRTIIEEMLEPTTIYVKDFLNIAEQINVKAAVHITGDAYLKFNNISNFSPNIGFEFEVFNPHLIFELIKESAKQMGYNISNQEMFKTFNMGWGFAVIVDKKDREKTIKIIEEINPKAKQIGRVTNTKQIIVKYEGKNIVLT